MLKLSQTRAFMKRLLAGQCLEQANYTVISFHGKGNLGLHESKRQERIKKVYSLQNFAGRFAKNEKLKSQNLQSNRLLIYFPYFCPQ
jgi:hypothetical protein